MAEIVRTLDRPPLVGLRISPPSRLVDMSHYFFESKNDPGKALVEASTGGRGQAQ